MLVGSRSLLEMPINHLMGNSNILQLSIFNVVPIKFQEQENMKNIRQGGELCSKRLDSRVSSFSRLISEYVHQLNDDRFAMVRSNGNVKKPVVRYREYMELRSMSKRPPPPYTSVDAERFMNSHDDSTTRKGNGVSGNVEEEEDDSSPVIIKNECSSHPCCKYLSHCVLGMFLFLSCVVLTSLMFPYPLHASCTVTWKFDDPCTYAMHKFRNQILNWSTCMNCGPRYSRCLYTLQEPRQNESNVIRAMHLGPNLRTVESIKLNFEDVNNTCMATGESVSNEWFRIFDYGTNYCNLRNLVIEIGFDKSDKFLEVTTNAICTQYNMATCN